MEEGQFDEAQAVVVTARPSPNGSAMLASSHASGSRESVSSCRS
jgi:hypothetical protein